MVIPRTRREEAPPLHRPQRRYPSRCTSSTLNHLGVLKVRVFSGFSTYSLLDFGHFHIVSKSLSRVMSRSPVSSRASYMSSTRSYI